MTATLEDISTLSVSPQEYRFSVEEYYRLGDLGFFIDQRVELIDGRIIAMPPQGNAHDIAIKKIEKTFEKLLSDQFWVRADMSINFDSGVAPEPDIAIVAGHFEDRVTKPTTAFLIVEISETTLSYDRTIKASLYASNGIEDYWIVNLVNRRLEIFRKPRPISNGESSHQYSETQILEVGQVVSPLAFPSIQLLVDQLMPKKL